MSTRIDIGRHCIGFDEPTYFVADIAANHDGDLSRAKELIHLCAEAGAQAAKFQNFLARTIVSDHGFRTLAGKQSHQAKWKKSVFEVYQDATLPLEWTRVLMETCEEAGIDYFTSPYDLDILEMLDPYVCAWKLGSGDITWHAMIERLAKGGKPLLMATGAAAMDEVRMAMDVASRHSEQIVLMQCNTNYTASVENFHHIALNVLKTYAREFPDTVLGLSDHTHGHATVLGAVALGARVVEKHFTDDNGREGPDHKFAMNPASWRDMVDRTRELEAALGTEEKRVMDNERDTVVIQRRAVRAARALAKGEVLSESDLCVLRPCPVDALAPHRMGELVGKRVRCDIEDGAVILAGDVE